MATTNYSALASAAYAKLVAANAGQDKLAADARSRNKTNNQSLKDSNAKNVGAAAVSAADRGFGRSGVYVQQQKDIAKNYNTALNLSNTNLAGTLAAVASKKLAAKGDYDKTMAGIKQQQQADKMKQLAATLPKGIDFAALARMSGGK